MMRLYEDFDGENKPKIYALLDEKIAEYWSEVKTIDEEIEGWEEEKQYEDGEKAKGEDYVNVWLYYSECKRICGILGSWLPEMLYIEYSDYICDNLEV
ncbi:MAG: hypothetical protein KKE64_08185 [Candidatus Omnitrophica bacterium]|nr:hypothetical protein [Candidatus Omnitrophota bacterium]